MTTQKKGFTLIELLVVIAIIGILSAIGLVSLNGAREKARDAQRQSDIATMRTALQLYTDDHNNQFPTVAASGVIEDVSGNFTTAMNSSYLASIPAATGAAAACNEANHYWYVANGANGTANDATTFALAAQLERAGCKQGWVVNQAGFGGVISMTTANNIDAATCSGATSICNNATVTLP